MSAVPKRLGDGRLSLSFGRTAPSTGPTTLIEAPVSITPSETILARIPPRWTSAFRTPSAFEQRFETRARLAEFDALTDDLTDAEPFSDEAVEADTAGREVAPVFVGADGNPVVAGDRTGRFVLHQ